MKEGMGQREQGKKGKDEGKMRQGEQGKKRKG